MTHRTSPLRVFWFSAVCTVIIGVLTTIYGGIDALWLFAVLAILEVTFSFDNAVLNARVLARLSPLWQKLFLTIGIVTAVFVVRFLLPIVIVMIATGIGFGDVLHLALDEPQQYAGALQHAAPMIDAFGGTFLMMIGLNYFVDREKNEHWLKRLERHMARAGRLPYIQVIVAAVALVIVTLTVEETIRTTVLVAGICGIVLHLLLDGMARVFDGKMSGGKKAAHQVGWAAFASFLYLEVLDASFSFDGVIGAFAITSSVLLIVAGLGAGALWVRSLTVFLMRSGTLAKYRYLEHGAHWAILVLGVIMIVKLYGVEPAEWLTGSVGLVCIAAAVGSSVWERDRE